MFSNLLHANQGLFLPFKGILPTVHPTAFIAPGAILIGDVTVGANSSVWYGCVLRGDVAPIIIGERTNIQDGTVIHVASDTLGKKQTPTIIEDDVTVGHQALLHACHVESRCLVGMKSLMLDGSILHSESMLAAHSMLTKGKSVPSKALWGGSPAKPMRELTPEELVWLALSASHYVTLAAQSKSDLAI
ncbi:MAG: gamma carbonic anhydrase family protein [Vampirovibrionales bacterium]